MGDSEGTIAQIDQAGVHLFRFAIDRGDMQTILDVMPGLTPDMRAKMEYEIQLLRIVSVGWAIAFFLSDDNLGNPLGASFWEQVRIFSATLSTSAALTVDTTIDYFAVLKRRLDFYVEALNAAGKIPDPVMVIGPAFAEVCGDKQDACASLAGSKMFTHTLYAVREYLDGFIAQQD